MIIAQGDYVWIFLNGITTWFRTSPVLKCEKMEGGFKLETENSFYELRT